jgi:high-affinity Fe2+/Pb2+ permease
MKARKPLQAAIVCSIIIAASLQTQAKKPDLSDEVLSAKTIAIRVKLEGGTVAVQPKHRWVRTTHAASSEELNSFYQSIYSAIEEVFTRKQRFQVVSDASKADLVCVVALYDLHLYKRRLNGTALSVVMILKGGQSANWDAAPIWVESTLDSGPSSHLDQVAQFHDHLQDAQKKKDH